MKVYYSPGLATTLQNLGHVEWADLYLFTFSDGSQLALTNLDRDLTTRAMFPGTVIQVGRYPTTLSYRWHAAKQLVKRSNLKWGVGVKPNTCEFFLSTSLQNLLPSGLTFTQAVAAGLLDFMTIQVWRVYGTLAGGSQKGFAIQPDGSAVSQVAGASTTPLPLFYGYLAENPTITRTGVKIVAADPRILLNIQMPRHLWQPSCRFQWGDPGCTIVRDSFRKSTSVAAGSTSYVVESPTLNQPYGWFDLGVLKYTSGQNLGFATTIANYLRAGSTYFDVLMSMSPIAYYRLNDPVGSRVAKDYSGNGYNGTVTGGVTFGQTGLLTGDSTTAALFDGSSGYITTPIPDPKGTPQFAGGLTWTCIIKCPAHVAGAKFQPVGLMDTAPTQLYAIKSCQGPPVGLTPIMDWGKFHPSVDVSSLVGLTATFHITLVAWGKNNLALYINGELTDNEVVGGTGRISWGGVTADFGSSSAPGLPTLGRALRLTNNSIIVGDFFNGTMQEWALFGFPLSADQVFLLFKQATTAPAALTTDQFTLVAPSPFTPAVGDTFQVWPGCDKTVRSCTVKYNNFKNYGGFPVIPENETGI